MTWHYEIDINDGLGKLHKTKGRVPLEGPMDDILRYAMRASLQQIASRGEYCPGPFKVERVLFQKIHD